MVLTTKGFVEPGVNVSSLLIVCFAVFTLLQGNSVVVHAFNVDTTMPIVYTHNDSESQFGFAIALHRDGQENMLLVGAPRAESAAFISSNEIHRSGAFFKCPIDSSSFSASQSQCAEVIVDDIGHEYTVSQWYEQQRTNASGQWLGATVQSGGPDQPVVVCRPLYQSIDYIHTPSEWRRLQGGCFIIQSGLSASDHAVLTGLAGLSVSAKMFNPCAEPPLSYDFGCELGSGVAIHDDGIVYGAIAACRGNGKFWHSEQDGSSPSSYPDPCPNGYRPQSHYEYYRGYAVAFGDFKGSSTPEIVVSAPRWNHGYGRVILYDDGFVEYLVIADSDFGTYFGHALAVSDLNNDGTPDLVIGSPLYTDREKTSASGWEVGKIEIYYNDNQGSFFMDDVDSATGPGPGCRYGHSLAAIGDIDGDGFNDLAVGAPYCQGGEDGRVYIYYGSGEHVRITLSAAQVVSPATLERNDLLAFGSALSAGLDIDGNLYPDIAVGSYQSQTAVILRSRAVVLAQAEIFGPEDPVDLNNLNMVTSGGTSVAGFNVTVCITFEGHGVPDDLVFSYQASLDSLRQPINRRSVFSSIDSLSSSSFSSEVEGTISLSIGQRKCEQHVAYILPTIRDKQVPLTLQLDYLLVQESSGPNTVPPVLARTVNRQILNSTAFLRQCANSTCYPDLAIQAEISGTMRLVIGSSQTLALDVRVTNAGEDAFLSTLDVNHPTDLFFVSASLSSAGAIISCSSSPGFETCDIGNPIPAFSQMTFQMQYQTAVYSTFSGDARFNLTANSNDDETAENRWDNTAAVSVPVIASSALSLQGTANPEFVIITESEYSASLNRSGSDQIGPQIEHVISFQNKGPSFIGVSTMEILLPLRLTNGDLLLNSTNVAMDTSALCELSNIQNDATRAMEDTESPPANRSTLRLDCPSSPECLHIRCALAAMGTDVDSTIVITITARLSAQAALSNKEVSVVELVSSITTTVEEAVYPGVSYDPEPLVAPIEVQTEIHMMYDQTEILVLTQPRPIWVYIVSPLIGLLILITLIAVLFKVGFFRRKKLTGQQKMQYQESVRSRAAAAAAAAESGPEDDADFEMAVGPPFMMNASVENLVEEVEA